MYNNYLEDVIIRKMRGHHLLFVTDKAANLNATSLSWALKLETFVPKLEH